MSRKLTRTLMSLCMAFCLLCLMPLRAAAWGKDGHHIVARIAMWRLREMKANKVLKKINDILASIPETPMLKKPSTIDAAAVWPDDVRGSDEYRFADNLHFVSILVDKSVDKDQYVKGKHCRNSSKVPQVPEGVCVIGALEHYKQVLATSTSKKARLEALSFIIHFMGDLHQPLHTSEDKSFINFMNKKGDRGGNFRFIFYLTDPVFNSNEIDSCLQSPKACSEQFVKSDGEIEISNMKLHAAWDKFMIRTEMNSKPERKTVAKYVADLVRLLPTDQTSTVYTKFESGDPIAWAEESHDLAEKNAYDLIGPKIKISPEDEEERDFYLLNEAYRKKNITIVDRQLVRAGIRLAAFLRAAFPD